jgi:hypothetical protein
MVFNMMLNLALLIHCCRELLIYNMSFRFPSKVFTPLLRSHSKSTLSFTKHGVQESEYAPVLFLHGLFGSKINFSRHSRRIAAELKTEVIIEEKRIVVHVFFVGRAFP